MLISTTERPTPPPLIRRVDHRVLLGVLVPMRAVRLGALVARAVEPVCRPVAVPPVVVHPAQPSRDRGPNAFVGGAHGGASSARGGRGSEVGADSGGEVVVDQPRTRLAARVNVLTQPPAHDRRGVAELRCERGHGSPVWHADHRRPALAANLADAAHESLTQPVEPERRALDAVRIRPVFGHRPEPGLLRRYVIRVHVGRS